MAEGRGVVRLSITVPAELKDEMDSVQESVNWSGVAGEAFRNKLLELQATRKGKSMGDTIKRLAAAADLEKKKKMSKADIMKRMKAAAKMEASELYDAGCVAGTEWAQNKARPNELKRLSKLVQHFRGDVEEYVKFPRGGPHFNTGVSQVMCYEISNDMSMSALVFWGDEIGPLLDYDDFARGFVDGALNVWKVVEPHVWPV